MGDNTGESLVGRTHATTGQPARLAAVPRFFAGSHRTAGARPVGGRRASSVTALSRVTAAADGSSAAAFIDVGRSQFSRRDVASNQAGRTSSSTGPAARSAGARCTAASSTSSPEKPGHTLPRQDAAGVRGSVATLTGAAWVAMRDPSVLEVARGRTASRPRRRARMPPPGPPVGHSAQRTARPAATRSTVCLSRALSPPVQGDSAESAGRHGPTSDRDHQSPS